MNTKLFFWNVRGFNEPDKYQPFVKWLNTTKPIFGALLKTRIKEANLNQIMSTTCSGWNFTCNHNQDDSGWIILIWKHPASVRVIDQTSQSITCEILLPSIRPFVYTAIYASNFNEERVLLWRNLVNLQQTSMLSGVPWVV